MSSAALAAQRLDKGKQPDRGVFDQHDDLVGNQHDRHRAYHMQMVEHERNNALSLLNAHFFDPSIYPPVSLLKYAFRPGHDALKPKGGLDRDGPCGMALSPVTESTVESTYVLEVGVDSVKAFSSSSSQGARGPAQLSASDGSVHPALRNSKLLSWSNNQGSSRRLDAFSGTSSSSLGHPFHPTQQMYAEEYKGHAPLQSDPELFLAHGRPLGPDPFYSTSDFVHHPYDILDRGAFGEASVCAPQSGLGSADMCIDPGTLQVPLPMISRPSPVRSNSYGNTEQSASHELIEAYASSLRSARSSPSKEVLFPRKSKRRSSDSAATGPCTGLGNRGHKRKFIWTSSMANQAQTVPQAQKEREWEEVDRFEAGGAETKRDRRRLQNRMAQRAYRARSKRQKNAETTYLTELEELVGHQRSLLDHMGQILARLRAEQLRTDRWQEAVPADVPAGVSAGSMALESHYNVTSDNAQKEPVLRLIRS